MGPWDFFDKHEFVAWCALWLGWGVVLVALWSVALVFKIVNRLLRTIKVVCRGWPPAHLDADGDFRPEPDSASAEATTGFRVINKASK